MATTILNTKSGQITQILYLTISPSHGLGDSGSPASTKWSAALDLIQRREGLQKLYWGRRLEEPEKVQLHLGKTFKNKLYQPFIEWFVLESRIAGIQTKVLNHFTVWADRQHSDAFLSSVLPSFQSRIKDSLDNNTMVQVRHTTLHHQALEDPFGPSLLGFPIGTAIYKKTNSAWHEGAWPLWTHVVRRVDGCRGIAGGSVAEPVEGQEGSYLVYVAWESVKHHGDYHHTEHFQRHRVILEIGNEGWTEYGHILFAEVRYGQLEGQLETNKL